MSGPDVLNRMAEKSGGSVPAPVGGSLERPAAAIISGPSATQFGCVAWISVGSPDGVAVDCSTYRRLESCESWTETVSFGAEYVRDGLAVDGREGVILATGGAEVEAGSGEELYLLCVCGLAPAGVRVVIREEASIQEVSVEMGPDDSLFCVAFLVPPVLEDSVIAEVETSRS